MGLFDIFKKNKKEETAIEEENDTVVLKPQEEPKEEQQEDKFANRKEYNISVKESIDKQKLFDFINVLLKYVTPNKIQAGQYKSGHGYRYYPKRLPEAFEEEFCESNKRIRFRLKGDEFFFFVLKERLDRNIRITLSIKKDLADKMFDEIENFITDEAFLASESDYTDNLNQNSRTVYLLESGGETEDPKHSGICGVQFEPINKDFQNYPGYRFWTYGYGLGAFYRMWFGKDSYEILDKDTLRNFSCYENIVLDNDVTRITLYEDVLDYDKKENRDKQMAFRKVLNIDEIAAKLRLEEEEERKLKSDPEINIQEGNFEHGGVRLIQTYLKDGEIAHRFEADSVEERELDENGREVFSVIKEIINE